MTRTLWPLLTGFILWALAFIALYALQHMGCFFTWDPVHHRAALIGVYMLALVLVTGHLALQIAFARKKATEATSVERIGIATTIAALAATAITLAPALVVSACL